jgi:glycosyltransferase A (GT-A) superfamily protein (DUF2064 family)
MTPGLAVFVKTPGRSPVKSRLWPAIGREAAEALYLDCAAAVTEIVVQLQEAGWIRAYFAVAEADPAGEPPEAVASHGPWRELPTLAQGEGDLGERMAAVYAHLHASHGAALLIGSDVPQLQPAAIEDACVALRTRRADLVIGPGEDGGFWLIGGRVPLPHSSWTAPRYSSAAAYADLLAALPAGLRVHEVARLRDLDEPDDFGAVAQALRALPARTPGQARALHHLDRLCARLES